MSSYFCRTLCGVKISVQSRIRSIFIEQLHGPVGEGPEEATAMIWGLWELGLFSLEKRRLQGDRRAAFQHLKKAYRKDGDRVFSRACSDSTRGNGF